MENNSRREPRRNATGTYSICWRNEDGQMKSAEVQALNASQSGIRLASPIDVPLGTALYLEAKSGLIRGYAIVRNSSMRDGTYCIGLEFDEETKARVADPAAVEFDYYEFLQISPKAEFPTIQRIYRFMASRFHPDNPETGDPEKFILLKRAYEVLSDPQRRAEYDATREAHDARLNPIFEMSDFVNGIEGEANRRLGVLSLLYNKRRTDSDNPQVSLYDLEKRMGWPREYLDFTTWYLRSKQYITRTDNADFTITALGVDFVETNYATIPMLKRLLNSGARTATSPGSPVNHAHSRGPEETLLREPDAPHGENGANGGHGGRICLAPVT